MNLKTLKMFVVASFATSAAAFFLLSSAGSRAQTSESAKKHREALEKVADYKTWKQVLKPEKPADAAENKAQPVFSASIGG